VWGGNAFEWTGYSEGRQSRWPLALACTPHFHLFPICHHIVSENPVVDGAYVVFKPDIFAWFLNLSTFSVSTLDTEETDFRALPQSKPLGTSAARFFIRSVVVGKC
jgi:hypothetical protein